MGPSSSGLIRKQRSAADRVGMPYVGSSSSSISSMSSSSSTSSVSKGLHSLGFTSNNSLSSLSDLSDFHFDQESDQSFQSSQPLKRSKSSSRSLSKPLFEFGAPESEEGSNGNVSRQSPERVSFIIGAPQSTSVGDTNVVMAPTPFSVGDSAQLKYEQNSNEEDQHSNPDNAMLSPLVSYIAKNMMDRGICVVDKFLSEATGNDILDEVKTLHHGGNLTDGQLVYSRENTSSQDIRGDKIAWKDGTEPGCSNIGALIYKMDAIIMQCRGLLGNLVINGRTKV